MPSNNDTPIFILPSIREMFPEYIEHSSDKKLPISSPHHRAISLINPHQCTCCLSFHSHHNAGIGQTPPPLPYKEPGPWNQAPWLPPLIGTVSESRKHSRLAFDRSTLDEKAPQVLHSSPLNSFIHQHVTSNASPSFKNHYTRSGEARRVTYNSKSPHPAGNTRSLANSRDLNGVVRTAGPSATRNTRSLGSGYQGIIYFPASASNSSDDTNCDGELFGPDNKPKHICPTCGKGFSRPSSLRIHTNTHTGATPFRCPWPDCGREFNVNSNMRRHYRNHITPDNCPSFASGGNERLPTSQVASTASKTSVRPVSPSVSNGGSDDDIPELVARGPSHGNEEDELQSTDETSSNSETSSRRYSWSYRIPENMSDGRMSRSRSCSRISSSNSAILPSSRPPSFSPSPPPLGRVYNASAPYISSLTDSRVSTALRPAFTIE